MEKLETCQYIEIQDQKYMSVHEILQDREFKGIFRIGLYIKCQDVSRLFLDPRKFFMLFTALPVPCP